MRINRFDKYTKDRYVFPYILVVTVALLVHFPFILARWEPAVFSDTQGYVQMATVLQNAINNHFQNGLPGNIGARTPIYPLILVAFHQQLEQVVMLQILLGVTLALVILAVTWHLTHHMSVTIALGLFPMLNLAQIFFEQAIMSEILASFLFVVFLLVFGIMDRPGKRPGNPRIFLSGIMAALCLLTRPVFLFLAPAGWIVLLLTEDSFRHKIIRIFLFTLPILTVFLGWSWINSINTGQFTFSTLTGYNLVNHTGAFFEYLPDTDATLRDIYLQHRAIRIAESGTQSMTIWRAFDDLVQATGLNYFTLSKELTRLSTQLILHHPFQYLESVGKAWIGFWKVPLYWHPEQITDSILRQGVQIIWWIEKYIQIGMNVIFILLSGVLGWKATKKQLSPQQTKLLHLAVFIFSASVLQALVEYGENPRYGFPSQVMIIWFVVIYLWDSIPLLEYAIPFRLVKRSTESESAD